MLHYDGGVTPLDRMRCYKMHRTRVRSAELGGSVYGKILLAGAEEDGRQANLRPDVHGPGI
jgi:hypothetical protein